MTLHMYLFLFLYINSYDFPRSPPPPSAHWAFKLMESHAIKVDVIMIIIIIIMTVGGKKLHVLMACHSSPNCMPSVHIKQVLFSRCSSCLSWLAPAFPISKDGVGCPWGGHTCSPFTLWNAFVSSQLNMLGDRRVSSWEMLWQQQWLSSATECQMGGAACSQSVTLVWWREHLASFFPPH